MLSPDTQSDAPLLSTSEASAGQSLLKWSRYFLFGLVLIPLVLSSLAWYSSTQHGKRLAATLATERFILSLDELLSTVQDAETGQRGYLLSGSGLYLAPYLRAEREVDRRLSHAIDLGAHTGLAPSTWQPLQTAIHAKFDELAITLELHRSGHPEAALAELRSNRGQQQMTTIRVLISRLKAQQTAKYERLYEQTQASERHLTVALVCGVFLAPLLLLAVFRVNTLYVKERDASEASIRRLNEELEHRVQERTAELEARTRYSEAQAAELERSNTDLEQFASIASHDLQEPLRMIASYMGMLSRRYGSTLDDAARTYIQFAVDGAKRMQTLINDLLAYSRAGTQEIKKQFLPFEQVVSQAAANLQLAIRENSVVLDCGALPTVQADETKLIQVVQNLLGNAIKFRKPGVIPEIKLNARRQGPDWLFSVADNGIGFDPKYSDRIFLVFQRLHGAGRYPGNGIGLSICRRIVEHHGGRLWAESEPGSGSTFFFTLPA